jgi:hypothetical protein
MTETIIPIITGLAGVAIGHLLTRDRETRTRFNIAAEQFRLAFWPEVEFLDKPFIVDRASINVTRRSCDVLFDAIGRHQKAFFMFYDQLGCINKRRFKKAWKEYCKGGCDIKYFSEEYPCGDNFQQYASEAKALKRINDILKFANPK